MFDGFANVWTPLVQARILRRAPLRVVLAGEPIVLFRGEGGAIGALIDRCPHRGVALSLGRVGADGCLECPFHGWRFAPDGSNRHVPLSPDARRETLGAAALPVRRIAI
jgi:phenylpropionate dioxygenase-like ring-hydroxylating dioxygenase large terminal subunit